MIPAEVTWRIALFPASAIRIVLLGPIATSCGLKSVAMVAVPTLVTVVVFPATVAA